MGMRWVSCASAGGPVRFTHPKPYFVRQLMRRIGIAAIVMPWRRVYILPEYEFYAPLVFHELIHIEQIERDGPWKFSVLYLWWLVRYGYWHNPYEVEAYARTERQFWQPQQGNLHG